MSLVRLKDIAKITMGNAPPGNSYNEDGNGVPLIAGAADFGAAQPEPKKFTTGGTRFSKEDDIIMCIRATIGDLNWSDKEYCLGRGVAGISVDEKLADKNYVYFALKERHEYLNSLGTGSTFRQIRKEVIENCEIILPTLKKQKEIANIFRDYYSLRGKRISAKMQLEETVKATFVDLFGDPVKNTREWQKKKIGEVSESRLGKMLDKKKQTGNNSKKYLRNANVQWGRFDLSNLYEMDFDEKDQVEFELRKGDLLVCEGGEVGRCAVWNNNIEDCYFQKALHRVRVDLNLLEPMYLRYLLEFYASFGGFDGIVTQATIAHLTGVKLKALEIPIPPIELQRKFSEYVESITHILEMQKKSFEDIAYLEGSLMAKFLKGES